MNTYRLIAQSMTGMARISKTVQATSESKAYGMVASELASAQYDLISITRLS